MITRPVAILTVYCFVSSFCLSQDYFYNNRYYDNDFLFEMNVSAGAINCLTDLGGRAGEGKGFVKDLNIPYTKFCGGITTGFVYRYVLGARLECNAGTIEASDNILKNDKSAGGSNRYKRNLHFKSRIYELLLLGEIYPLAIFVTGREKPSRFMPYITGGFGLFYFNPQANINGSAVYLQPLHTEGQGFPEYADRKQYKLTQKNFPVGAGLKYELSPLCNLRFEILHRITTTDYLDDVSTRYIEPSLFQQYLAPDNATLAMQLHDRQAELNPLHKTTPGSIRGRGSKKDSYFTVQLKIGLILGRQRR